MGPGGCQAGARSDPAGEGRRGGVEAEGVGGQPPRESSTTNSLERTRCHLSLNFIGVWNILSRMRQLLCSLCSFCPLFRPERAAHLQRCPPPCEGAGEGEKGSAKV